MIETKVIKSAKRVKESFPLVRELKGTGVLVMFHSEHSGIVIHSTSIATKVGRYSDAWVSCLSGPDWEPWQGTVEISSK